MTTGLARLTCNLLSRARQSSCKLLTSTSIRLNILQTQFKYIRVSVQEDSSGAQRAREPGGHSLQALYLHDAPLPVEGTRFLSPLHSSEKPALMALMPAANKVPSLPSRAGRQPACAQEVGGCGSSPSYALSSTAGVSFSGGETFEKELEGGEGSPRCSPHPC